MYHILHLVILVLQSMANHSECGDDSDSNDLILIQTRTLILVILLTRTVIQILMLVILNMSLQSTII